MRRVLVAGIGNIFMGDDGFGCEVARRLSCMSLPEGVDVVDFGIRGMDLSFVLEDGYDLAILIDTIDRGGPPGTLCVVEPEVATDTPGDVPLSPHGMDPASVLKLAALAKRSVPRVALVACVPEWLGGEEGHLGLSDAVANAVADAVIEVETMLREEMQNSSRPPPASNPQTTANWNREVPGETR